MSVVAVHYLMRCEMPCHCFLRLPLLGALCHWLLSGSGDIQELLGCQGLANDVGCLVGHIGLQLSGGSGCGPTGENAVARGTHHSLFPCNL